MINSLAHLLQEHGRTLFTAFLAVIFFGVLSVGALVMFVRWIVHTEVETLTSAMHRDIIQLGADVRSVAGRRWTDAKLDDEFTNLRTIVKSLNDEFEEIQRDHIRFHGPRPGPG